MTDILELFSGVCIIIDDALESETRKEDLIWKIKENIQRKNIPILEYYDLPDDESIKHFKNINFILLDWELFKKPIPGLAIDTTPFIRANIDFIRKINAIAFVPIFIFSNEQPDSIINHLVQAGIYNKEKRNHIFVKQKSDLIDDKNENLLFEEIEKWIKEMPSVYVLKEWEIINSKAKSVLFWELYNISPHWATILWKIYSKDNVDTPSELGNLISKNLVSLMTDFNFDDTIMDEPGESSSGDIRRVIEGERFIRKELLNTNYVYTGDIFKKGGKYYLNVRPQCDCIARIVTEIFDIELYCVKGSKLSKEKMKKYYNEDYGLISEQDTNTIVFPINHGEAIDFRFNELIKFKYSEIKDDRIGRLMPPFITRIQQKYAAYMQRQGFPRMPKEAIG
nr:hypothetical protein [Bacteroidota bacterium]